MAPTGTTVLNIVAAVGVTPTGEVNTPPLKITVCTPVRFVPFTVISAPTGAAAGAKLVARGGCCTTRFAALVAVPSTVVMLIFPVTAPSGTLKRTSEAVAVGTSAGGSVNAPTFTIGVPVAARRFVPSTITGVVVPATTLAGANSMILGC